MALDGSEDARAAFVFVSDWARTFDARVWFIQLTEESSGRHCGIRTDVSRRGRHVANQFTVSGATRGARDQQLASGIADAAQAFGADLIVLGIDRRRLARNRFSRSVREQLTAATDVPVLMAPKVAPKPSVVRVPAVGRREPAVARREPAIALGPALDVPVMAGAGLAHV